MVYFSSRTGSRFQQPFYFPRDFNRHRDDVTTERTGKTRENASKGIISRRNRGRPGARAYLKRKIKNKQRRHTLPVCTCTSISSWFGRAPRNNSPGVDTNCYRTRISSPPSIIWLTINHRGTKVSAIFDLFLAARCEPVQREINNKLFRSPPLLSLSLSLSL